VAVVGIAVGLYFGLAGGKKGKGGGAGGGGGGGSGVSEAEISAIDNWYRDVTKQLGSFLGEVCSVHHNRGYKYNSHFHKRVQTQTVKGQKVQTFDFEVKIQPAQGGKPQGVLNIFECPVKLAEIHRDNPITLEAKIWEKRQVFGPVYTFADITILGKLLDHLDKTYRTINRNVVMQNRGELAFNRMKSMPKEPRYEGYRTLSTPMTFRMGQGLKSFTMSNLTWKRIAYGKYLQGTWRLTMRSNEFRKQLKDWDDGCFGFRKRIAKLDKPKGKHTTHLKLTRVERLVTKELCDGLKLLVDATQAKPVDATRLNKARVTLAGARDRWNKDVYGALKDLAKKTDSGIRAKPL
jgi:hypothetical protein